MFDKKEILVQVLDQLQKNLATLVRVAHEAREAATHEDAKAENKYDTRGLEASYLAGAQAKRAKDLQDVIDSLKQIQPKNFMDTTPIAATALVQVEIDDSSQKWFFVLPSQGGLKAIVEGEEIQVISPQAPIGRAMLGKTVGHVFAINQKNYEILEVW